MATYRFLELLQLLDFLYALLLRLCGEKSSAISTTRYVPESDPDHASALVAAPRSHLDLAAAPLPRLGLFLMQPLLALLSASSQRAQESSIRAIVALTFESTESQQKVQALGGVALVAGLLTDSSGNAKQMVTASEICSLAAKAVEQLAEHSLENQVAFADKGVVQPLVNMLGSTDNNLQANGAGAQARAAGRCSC